MPSFLGGKLRDAALFVESYSLCKSTWLAVQFLGLLVYGSNRGVHHDHQDYIVYIVY